MTIATIVSTLPDIPSLVRICKAIAMLDAILCEEWEFRYYSFNSHWSKDDPSEMMASMRDGSGDDYFIWFSSPGAAIKGFAHESPMSPANNNENVWPGVLSEVPAAFSPFLNEPAFEMDWITFCFWRTAEDSVWHSGAVKYPSNAGDDPDGAKELLKMLDGKPSTYIEYARSSFDAKLDEDSVRHVYELKPLTPQLLKKLGSERSLEDLTDDIAEIGY